MINCGSDDVKTEKEKKAIAEKQLEKKVKEKAAKFPPILMECDGKKLEIISGDVLLNRSGRKATVPPKVEVNIKATKKTLYFGKDAVEIKKGKTFTWKAKVGKPLYFDRKAKKVKRGRGKWQIKAK